MFKRKPNKEVVKIVEKALKQHTDQTKDLIKLIERVQLSFEVLKTLLRVRDKSINSYNDNELKAIKLLTFGYYNVTTKSLESAVKTIVDVVDNILRSRKNKRFGFDLLGSRDKSLDDIRIQVNKAKSYANVIKNGFPSPTGLTKGILNDINKDETRSKKCREKRKQVQKQKM